jgi:predicted transcriptional regulator
MTLNLEIAIERAKSLPAEAQDELAELILGFADGEAPSDLTPEDEATFEESLAQADRGAFATDDEMAALWAKFG